MSTVEQLDHLWESINDVGSDFGTQLGPWLIDVPFAWAAGSNAYAVFGWPVPVAACVGVGTELIGLAATRQMLRMKDYNSTKSADEPRAPHSLAALTVVLYFGGTAALMMLDALTSLAIPARLVIPLMGIVGTLVHGMTLDHKRRIAANTERREQRRQERAQRRADVAQQTTASVAPVAASVAEPDTRSAILAIYGADPMATVADVAQQIGVTHQAVSGQLRRMEKAGAIRRNGHGVEVLAC